MGTHTFTEPLTVINGVTFIKHPPGKLILSIAGSKWCWETSVTGKHAFPGSLRWSHMSFFALFHGIKFPCSGDRICITLE